MKYINFNYQFPQQFNFIIIRIHLIRLAICILLKQCKTMKIIILWKKCVFIQYYNILVNIRNIVFYLFTKLLIYPKTFIL